MRFLKKRSVWVMITVYVAFWLAVFVVAGIVLDGYKNTINSTLGILDYRTETIDTGEKIDTEYYKSKYVKKDAAGNPLVVTDENGYEHQVYDDDALNKANIEKADQVQREGATLLWNTSNGLPLAAGNKVSLFSHSSVDYVYSGSGSAYARTKGASDMQVAFRNAGLTVNPTLWNFYKTGEGSSYTRTDRTKINEVPWSKYSSSVLESFSQYGDAAIIVLSRRMGEGSVSSGGALDASKTSADTASGDYFDLSAQEIKMLENVIRYKKENTFKKVIVLLNTPTALNFTDLMKFKNDIDSCMWIGQGGWEGLNEVGRIITGKSVPSGHLVDTFAYDAMSAPAAVNSDYSYYTNANSVGLRDVGRQGTYLVYAENIYVGYKYYETRYEDAVLGRYNANGTAGAVDSKNGWSYREEVAFPFGYGKAYTEFTYSDFKCEQKGDDYEITLTVTNTGNNVGADAVQVYIQKPYTDHDRQYGIEQAAVNLCGYAKTSELAVGAEEKVTILVDGTAFRTYDAENKKTYIYEAGEYYLTAAEDAHAAVNNILAAKGKTPANTGNVMDAEGNADFVYCVKNGADDYTKFAESEYTGNSITNRLDEADWNKYSHSDGSKVTYLSRKDWQGTYPSATPAFSVNAEMLADLNWDKEVEADPKDTMPLYGQAHKFNLIDMKGLEYDHTAWNDLLNQLTLDEEIKLLGNAYHGTIKISSITKPKDLAEDGPMGVRKEYLNSSGWTLSFPSNVLLAASFNDKLAEEVGELLGEDMLHSGVTCLYGPSANLHRTVYGGRSFEYYSEDGFISGMMAKAQVIGIQSKGCYVNMKHYALNDQESNRYGVAVWANEQSIREVYLPAFEISASQAKLTGLMSSFTRTGAVWSGASKGLMTDILRGEWGFDGFVLSDCAWRPYMGVVDGVMAGNDCILDDGTDLTAYEAARTNATVAQAMREAAHRILYVTVNTCAMNSYSANTRIIPIRVWWQNLVLGVQIGFAALTLVALSLTVLAFVFHEKIESETLVREKESGFGGVGADVFAKEKGGNIAYSSYSDDGSGNQKGGSPVSVKQKTGMSKKRIALIGTSVVLAVAIVVTAVVVPLSFNKPNPGDEAVTSGDSSGSGGSSDDEQPTTSGKYVFEAENPYSVEGTNASLRFDTEGRTVSATNNPSGGAFISKLTDSGTAILTYKVNAEEATNALLSLCMGRTGADRSLDVIFDITVNGTEVIPPVKVVFEKYEKVQYYDWLEKSVANVDLIKGENTIVFTKKTSGLNFDYFALTSQVPLSVGKTCEHAQMTDYSIVTLPTTESKGVVNAQCKQCRHSVESSIPALTDKGYTYKITEPNSEVSFGKAEYTYALPNGEKVNFTTYISPSGQIYSKRFEAEEGIISGGAKISFDASAVNTSGDKFLGNLSGNVASISLVIDSDREADMLLRICLGTRNDRDLNFDKIKLTLNGEAVELPSGLTIKSVASEVNWFNWHEYDLAVIRLKAGRNVITFANNGGTFTNIDYFALSGVAQTSWFVEE